MVPGVGQEKAPSCRSGTADNMVWPRGPYVVDCRFRNEGTHSHSLSRHPNHIPMKRLNRPSGCLVQLGICQTQVPWPFGIQTR